MSTEQTQTIRLRLDDDEFKKLVSGEVVTIHTAPRGQRVEIILADIGFDRMVSAIQEAMDRLPFFVETTTKPQQDDNGQLQSDEEIAALFASCPANSKLVVRYDPALRGCRAYFVPITTRRKP